VPETNHPMDMIVGELRGMRDRIATAARNEGDSISYRAFLLQARSVKAIEEQVAAQSAAASARATREDLNDEAVVEGYWLSLFSDWLEAHERTARESLDGGEVVRLPFAVSADEARTISLLHAKRHHEMISDFCHRHVAVLRNRVGELESDATRFSELTSQISRSPVR
jgi:hypothetical protein